VTSGPQQGSGGRLGGARAVLDVARDVLADLDLEAVLKKVLASARELTEARYAALGVLDSDGRRLERFLTLGIDEATRSAIGPLPTGRGVLGTLISHPAPLRLPDVGSHPQSYGFPIGHPPMGTFLGVPVVVGGRPYGNLYLTDKAGGQEFSVDDQEAVELLAEFAGVAIDHARRFTGSEARRRDLQQTVGALDATLQIARALGGQTDLDAILTLVAKRGRALVSARMLVVEYRQGSELVVAAGAGDLPPGTIGRRIDAAESMASMALRTLRPQRLEDELNRMRFEQHGLGTLGVEAEAGIAIPLVFRGKAYGALIAVDRLEDGPRFTADDVRLLEAFAASAATALATAQSVADERRELRLAASEQERGRWARELHDETLQGLAALRIGLSAAQKAGDPGAIRDAMGRAVDQLDAEIAGLRSLITELRPAALDELGVEAAIVALAERAGRGGLDVDTSIDLAYEQGRAATRHVAELETAMYRIVQEALTNAHKHGGAARAVVEVEETETSVRVVVRDDGAGFDPAQRADGFGLLGMHERVELVDGSLEIESAPGAGTTIRALLPAQRRDAAEAGPVTPPPGLRSVGGG
jgi:signal transduction histidine kinase